VTSSASAQGNEEPLIVDNRWQYAEDLQVLIPEVFELANIAIALTDFGHSHPYYVNTDTPYYTDVLEHFSPYRDHPFVDAVQRLADDGGVDGFNFLKHRASASRFDGDEIVSDKERLYLPTREDERRLEEELLLAASFARETSFRSFYEAHRPFYRERVAMFKAAIPARDAWNWLEEQFPQSSQERIRIYLSPLTGWSHFAVGKPDYTDIYIFGPPEFVASKADEGTYTMVLFTELDHRYVNAVSREFAEDISEAFADVRLWNGQMGYRTPQLTFNEYMTWAVFCLYASDSYAAEDMAEIVRNTTEFMTTNRRFPRFAEFNDHLLTLYRNREAGVTVPDLYPLILEWARDRGG
jgi:hypothetical protein